MKKSVILNTEQVKRLQETGTVVVDMVKPQPTVNEHGNYDYWKKKQGGFSNMSVKDMNNEFVGIVRFAPYQPGSTLYVRERWGELGEELFVWSEVDKYKNGNLDLSYIKWLSPATMPKDAARLFPVVASVECVRVKDVGTEQQYKLGFRCGCCDALGCGECSNTMDYSYELYIINRYGLSAWDNNAFIFITTFKIEK